MGERSLTVRIREANSTDAPAIARVHVDSWRTTYRGIVPDDYLAKLSYERRTNQWAQGLGDPESREFHYVAEDASDGVVGFVSGGPERSGDLTYTGELYRIWLLERHQRRGIGRQLVHATVERLAEAGSRSMLVWVLADNASRGFYEALGGQFVRHGQTEIGGGLFDQVAYGWSDTAKIGGV
jgi:ribosomal protein S18 acetylase RimI-like enzyme